MINTTNAIVTFTNVPFSPGLQLLANENGNRVGLLLYNNSNKNYLVYINWVEDTDEANYSFVIPPSGLYELPAQGGTTLNFYGSFVGEPAEDGTIKVTEISDR